MCTRSGHCGGHYCKRTAKLMELFIYWTCKVTFLMPSKYCGMKNFSEN
jgi:hypothetical protein